MTHSIIYNSQAHMIETKVQGDLKFNEVKEIITKLSLIAKENDCTLLIADYREATLKLSVIEIYQVPKLMQDAFASAGLNVHRLRRAAVVAKDIKGYLFHETIAVNRTQNLKVFYDIDEAKEWLLRK